MQIPPELLIYFLSMLPVGELRTSIPYAIALLDMPAQTALFFATAGTITIAVILFYFLDPVTKFLRKHLKFMDQFFEWLFHRTRTKHSKKMNDLGLIALFIFVMIPLPGSGAWTGTLIAYLFDVKGYHAIPTISLGIMASAVIVTFGTDLAILILS